MAIRLWAVVSRRLLLTLFLFLAAVGISQLAPSLDGVAEAAPSTVVKYAPVLVFHPDERAWPSNAEHFIANSSLKWNHDAGCRDTVVKGMGNATQSGLASGAYRARQKDGWGCDRYGASYDTSQFTRPNGSDAPRPAGLEGDEGFYLNLLNDHRTGFRSGNAQRYASTRSKIYYDYKPGRYIRYWVFYPGSWSPRAVKFIHEGDWEGITVWLTSEDRAHDVTFSQHHGEEVVPWSDVRRSGTTHPIVWVAKGAHASYKGPSCRTPYADSCGNGLRWRTWEDNGRLWSARDALWYGFGGAWGQAGTTANGTGPLGPSRYKDVAQRIVRGIDETAPTISGASVTLPDSTSRNARYSLPASDNVAVDSMRLAVNGVWRSWVSYVPDGTIVLPDAYGRFGISFQVSDAAGNVSGQKFAGTVTRYSAVGVKLRQIDNSGTVRSCGFLETSPCSDIVRRFRATITGDRLPDTGLALKAWRKIDGAWVLTDPSPVQREVIAGWSTDFALRPNLMAGLWRFRVQVPKDSEEFTGYGASGYQYLQISPPPDTTAPTITGASLHYPDPAAESVAFSLSATDNASAVTYMRALVNGAERPWGAFATNGTVVLPGYGTFGIGFQVMDAAGNISAVHYAGAVQRRAQVTLGLNQIDNYGNVRSCGSSETSPCSDVVKKFRTTITSALSPQTNLLLKAWRKIDGSWVETTNSPFMYTAINGRSVIDMEITAGLMNGIWRFQAQVPVTDATQFGASAYQYLRID